MKLQLRDQPTATVPCLRALVGYTTLEKFEGTTQACGESIEFEGKANVFTIVGYGQTPQDAKRMAISRGHKGGCL